MDQIVMEFNRNCAEINIQAATERKKLYDKAGAVEASLKAQITILESKLELANLRIKELENK